MKKKSALEAIGSDEPPAYYPHDILSQLSGGWTHYIVEAFYHLRNRQETLEYWNDPALRSHMLEVCQELLKLNGSIDWIMGYPDNLKLRSCMTLFWLVTEEYIFKDVLDRFYDGSLDELTLQKMMCASEMG